MTLVVDGYVNIEFHDSTWKSFLNPVLQSTILKDVDVIYFKHFHSPSFSYS